jgi:hypothetical protein
MFSQPVWEKNVKIILLRIGIPSGNKGYRTYPFKEKQHNAFCQYYSNTHPNPFVNSIDYGSIIQVNYYQIEEDPDDTVYHFNDNELSICRYIQIFIQYSQLIRDVLVCTVSR